MNEISMWKGLTIIALVAASFLWILLITLVLIDARFPWVVFIHAIVWSMWAAFCWIMDKKRPI